MSVLFVALPVAILMGAAAVVACVFCIRGGQFDDLETPAVRMLIDDKPDAASSENEKTSHDSECHARSGERALEREV